MARCAWAELSSQARQYHDEEWGVPHGNDRLLFDQLSFQVMQGGFSWVMVLGKREGIRRAFAGCSISIRSPASMTPTLLASSLIVE